MHEAAVGEATAAGAHRGRRRLGRLRPLSPGLPSRLARGSRNTLRRWPGRQRHRPAAPGPYTMTETCTSSPEPAGGSRWHPRGRVAGGAVDQQRVREFALPEARLRGCDLAIHGKPDRRVIRGRDVHPCSPPRMVNPAPAERAGENGGDKARPGQRTGVDHPDVEIPVTEVGTVGGRRPRRLIPAIAREVQPQPPTATVQDQLVRPAAPQHPDQGDDHGDPAAQRVLQLFPGVYQVDVWGWLSRPRSPGPGRPAGLQGLAGLRMCERLRATTLRCVGIRRQARYGDAPGPPQRGESCR